MHLISKKSSISGCFQKQRTSKEKMKNSMKYSFYFEPRKSVKVNYIKSCKPR